MLGSWSKLSLQAFSRAQASKETTVVEASSLSLARTTSLQLHHAMRMQTAGPGATLTLAGRPPQPSLHRYPPIHNPILKGLLHPRPPPPAAPGNPAPTHVVHEKEQDVGGLRDARGPQPRRTQHQQQPPPHGRSNCRHGNHAGGRRVPA